MVNTKHTFSAKHEDVKEEPKVDNSQKFDAGISAKKSTEPVITAKYDNKPVTIVRAATDADASRGWNADVKTEQVLIKYEDGTETVVAKRDLTEVSDGSV